MCLVLVVPSVLSLLVAVKASSDVILVITVVLTLMA
jgi:hypothetical protein